MRAWLTAEKTYEGFPLFLRRPTELDVELLRPSFPTLAVVTHRFTKREPNGLPQGDYNDGLVQMDSELVAAFDADRMGVPTLVETFGGKRHYYFYVAPDANVAATISAVARRYPAEQLSWEIRSDPNWGFFERYTREYF
ncbi:MAG TPA: DUF695 domain-containing protein [Verrucomicrobiae bacterium]|nr:DUF695 domain-containing protein [Verrucomicrobiae bacterium]